MNWSDRRELGGLWLTVEFRIVAAGDSYFFFDLIVVVLHFVPHLQLELIFQLVILHLFFQLIPNLIFFLLFFRLFLLLDQVLLILITLIFQGLVLIFHKFHGLFFRI